MMEINTTPLIDVMLVLLIMFIITIPVATHSVEINLPPPTPPNNPPPINPVKNKVSITDDGKVTWNGSQVTGGELRSLLIDTTHMNPEPELQFQPEEEASYDLSANVMNIIKASKVNKFGFFGNEQYSEFGKAPNAH
jgi:biopolymer transport protein ExbD